MNRKPYKDRKNRHIYTIMEIKYIERQLRIDRNPRKVYFINNVDYIPVLPIILVDRILVP